MKKSIVFFAAAAGLFGSGVAPASTGVACAPHATAVAATPQPLEAAAIRWAEARANEAIDQGKPLAPELAQLARKVGVVHPERVRIHVVDRIELPSEPALKAAASKVGLVPSSAGGMTLGYGVVLVRGEASSLRLLAHELRHVAQYEACGGIGPFLARHLGHLAKFGYADSPFERDARASEPR